MYNFKSDAYEKTLKDKDGIRSFAGEELLVNKPDGYAKSSSSTCANFLKDNKTDFNLGKVTYIRLKSFDGKVKTCKGSVIESVTYQQTHYRVPVYKKYFVVSINKKTGNIISAVNQFDYDLPNNLQPKNRKIDSETAKEIIRKECEKHFSTIEFTQPILYVYRHEYILPVHNKSKINKYMCSLGECETNNVSLVWRFFLSAEEKDTRKSKDIEKVISSDLGCWEILVDAISGKIKVVRDKRLYANPSASVFKPDPITSSTNPPDPIGNISFPANTATKLNTLNRLMKTVTLQNLDPPDPNTGKYKLNGKWVITTDILRPLNRVAEDTTFNYPFDDHRFKSVMAYYWIDTLVEYLRSFKVTKFNEAVKTTKVLVDAQASDSHFSFILRLSPNRVPHIVLNENSIPSATDAHMIVHEYGHAIHWFMERTQGVNGLGIEEGFGDFLAGVWLDRLNTRSFSNNSSGLDKQIRNMVFPWEDIKTSNPRRFDTNETFDPPRFARLVDVHDKGNVFAAALWDMYRLMGGDSIALDERIKAADTAIHMYLEMLSMITSNVASYEIIVEKLVEADKQLFQGANRSSIVTAFTNRKLSLHF